MTSSTSNTIDTDVPFQLRGSTFTMMVLKILNPSDPTLYAQLGNKIRQAPNFFHNAPVVLDLEDVAIDLGVPELAAIIAQLRQRNLVPVGVQGVPTSVQKAALAVGLAVMPAGRPAKTDVTESPAEPKPEATPEAAAPAPVQAPAPIPAPRPTMVVTEPVRSGQQVYAPQGDLIVLAPVSTGAELLADGNIHVYSSLRGRALAGLGGDTTARIFCHSLEAEMVSIAGLYRVSEDIDKDLRKKNVQVYLDDGFLRIAPLP